jgi:hypothetical protein
MLCLFNQADNEQQQDSTRGCGNDRANQASGRDTQQTKHKTADYRAYDTDNDIPEQAKATALHQGSGQPARHSTNRQKYYQPGYIHHVTSLLVVKTCPDLLKPGL